MPVAQAAPDPVAELWGLLCGALCCLFVVSAVILAIVLFRRNRKGAG
jgi:hypothetical protein